MAQTSSCGEIQRIIKRRDSVFEEPTESIERELIFSLKSINLGQLFPFVLNAGDNGEMLIYLCVKLILDIRNVTVKLPVGESERIVRIEPADVAAVRIGKSEPERVFQMVCRFESCRPQIVDKP